MRNKTTMITSIAVLVAVISVATTMTMAQADPIVDNILITIEGDAVPNFESTTVLVETYSHSPSHDDDDDDDDDDGDDDDDDDDEDEEDEEDDDDDDGDDDD